MPVVEAKRTLVKSPPELWAELSDPAALARHLEDFGDVRIVGVEPEKLVEWQSGETSGRVELDASGWGTKVTLSVRTPDPEPVAEAEPEPEPEPDPEPQGEPEPVAALEPPKVGWWARVFGRRRKDSVAVAVAEPVPVAEPEPIVVPEPETEPLVVAAAAPRPPHPELDVEEVLTEILEALGTAHHRPFSRA